MQHISFDLNVAGKPDTKTLVSVARAASKLADVASVNLIGDTKTAEGMSFKFRIAGASNESADAAVTMLAEQLKGTPSGVKRSAVTGSQLKLVAQ